jgi:homoserine kinase type II
MAVYTKVSGDEASALLRAYNIGFLRELTGIPQGVENTNYYLTTTEDRFILTIYEKRVREEDLPFFLGFMEHIAKKGVPCPVPVQAKDGLCVHPLAGRPAAILSFFGGEVSASITVEECAQAGGALASVHLAGADFSQHRANALSLPAWDRLLKACGAQADDIQSGLTGILQEELNYLQANWPKDLPSGVIHADLFHDNVLFRDSKLVCLLDFYFSCNDFFAYDLAITLNAWCFEHNEGFNITKARALIKGYREVRKTAPQELQALPLLARGAAMRFLLTRLYDKLHPASGADVKIKEPLEYLARLQFHQLVDSIDAYGLDP